MKKVIIITLIAIEILFNEFSFKILTNEFFSEFNFKNKIRYFNLVVLTTIIIFYFFYENIIKLKLIYKFFYIFLFIVLIDYLAFFANYGYKKNEEKSYRYIFPYDWERGEPKKLDHNEYGFRGKPPDIIRNNHEIIIGFFGGSTGYQGNPTIAELVSNELNKNKFKNNIINFSSISSNHNQHVHRLLEFSEYKYDIIIFYGGGNETIQHFYYDPRRGYPFNFYLHDSNSNYLKNVFIKYSNFIGELDKIFNLNSKINPKTSNIKDFELWAKEIKSNYFKTIQKSKDMTEKIIKPNKCERTFFIPIFQPLKPRNKRTKELVKNIRTELKNNYIYDFSNLDEKLKFTDIIHIDQKSKELVANEITLLIKQILKVNNC